MKPKQSAVFIVVTLIFMAANQGWAEKKKPSIWITEQETVLPARKPSEKKAGSLPKSDQAFPVSDQAMAGPIINIDKPNQKLIYKNLIDIAIRFTKNPFGEPVDMESLQVVLLKLWDIDLTERVRSFIKGTNIEASGVKFPSGEHEIEIRIKDQEKMESRLIFTIKVV
jgi:hypothetical protein